MDTSMLPSTLPGIVVSALALPDDLGPEVSGPESGVQKDLQVVPCRRIAVEIERARRLEHSTQLRKPRGAIIER